jgi:hypothetical protein
MDIAFPGMPCHEASGKGVVARAVRIVVRRMRRHHTSARRDTELFSERLVIAQE